MAPRRFDYIEHELTFEQIGSLIEEYVNGVNMLVLCNNYYLSESQVNYYVREHYTYKNKITEPMLIVVQSKINKPERLAEIIH